MIVDRLIKNWPIKLLAIVLAFAIWVLVTGENRTVKDVEAPLQITLSENRILASTPPKTVTVRLSGPESLMRRLDPVAIVLRVALEDSSFGERDVLLVEDDISGVPRGVEVVFIDPDRLNLKLDKRLRRELAVETTFLGQPPEGFAFYGEEVSPAKLVVEGPETEVRELELIRTNPIRLDQRRAPFIARVGAVPLGSHVRVLDATSVTVHVDVNPAPVEREFPEVAVVLAGQVFETEITPTAVRVTLTGPPAVVDGLEPGQIRATADVSELAPGDDTHQVELRIGFIGVSPEDQKRITVKSISRRKVGVQVSEGRLEP